MDDLFPSRLRLWFCLHPIWAVLLAFWAFLALPDGPAQAAAPRRKPAAKPPTAKQHLIEQIRARMNAARQTLAEAEVDAATLRATMEESGTEKDAEDALRSREAELLDAQAADSPVGRAKARVEKAQKALARLKPADAEEPPSAGDDTDSSKDSSKESTETTSEAPGDYEQASRDLAEAQRDYQQKKTELFRQDPQWRELSQARRQSKQGSAKANSDRAKLNRLEAKAAAARQVIADGQAELRKLGVKDPSTKSGKKKRKQ